MRRLKPHVGFTLIELLIVVAIIAILAAIAIPNFLAAVVRTRVARTLAQFQTVATAEEAYCVDNNAYAIYDNPLDDNYGQPGYPAWSDPATEGDNYLPFTLSTPVAYVTEINPDFIDVFQSHQDAAAGIPQFHDYHYKVAYLSYDYMFSAYTGQFLILNATDANFNMPAQWLVGSHGPCLEDLDFTIPYDPTNGLVSLGNPARFGPGFPGNGI
jgi:prepilin-type N-terminal cleavage/methylation domain-containing protein